MKKIEFNLYDDVKKIDEPVAHFEENFQSKYWEPAAWYDYDIDNHMMVSISSLDFEVSMQKIRDDTIILRIKLETVEDSNVLWSQSKTYDNAIECTLLTKKGKLKANKVRIVDKDLNQNEVGVSERLDDLNDTVASLNSCFQDLIKRVTGYVTKTQDFEHLVIKVGY